MMSYGAMELLQAWEMFGVWFTLDGITLPGPALHINYIKTKINLGWKFALSIELSIINREI